MLTTENVPGNVSSGCTRRTRRASLHVQSELAKRNHWKEAAGHKTWTEAHKLFQVLGAVLDSLKIRQRLRLFYIVLVTDILLLLFYVTFMTIQFERSRSHELTSSITMAVVPPRFDVPFMDWLKAQVLEVWIDPLCGDGFCQTPYEFPSFGRFGCESDCGTAIDVTPVLIYVQADFLEIKDTLPAGWADELRKRVSWNVCMHDTARVSRGLPETCWFSQEQHFEQLRTRALKWLELKHGEWYMRISNDLFEVVQ
ncbi:hypothetical protein CYMTET_32627, partial [Cymbomonas tetramitiformis]